VTLRTRGRIYIRKGKGDLRNHPLFSPLITLLVEVKNASLISSQIDYIYLIRLNDQKTKADAKEERESHERLSVNDPSTFTHTFHSKRLTFSQLLSTAGFARHSPPFQVEEVPRAKGYFWHLYLSLPLLLQPRPISLRQNP